MYLRLKQPTLRVSQTRPRNKLFSWQCLWEKWYKTKVNLEIKDGGQFQGPQKCAFCVLFWQTTNYVCWQQTDFLLEPQVKDLGQTSPCLEVLKKCRQDRVSVLEISLLSLSFTNTYLQNTLHLWPLFFDLENKNAHHFSSLPPPMNPTPVPLWRRVYVFNFSFESYFYLFIVAVNGTIIIFFESLFSWKIVRCCGKNMGRDQTELFESVIC